MTMLFVLAGCGNEEKTESSAGTETNSNNTVQEVNEEGEDVTNVFATSDNYAVVEANDKAYIINNNGEKQGTIDFEINDDAIVVVNNDGYVYYEVSNENNKILDKTGKVILENNNNETYNYITENNYTLKTSKESSFESGESTKKEIVDLSGKVIKTIEEETSYYYLGGDIWYCYGDDEFLFNENTDGNGFEYIYGNGENYYVQSGTGYFYVLDKDFNQLEEPYQLDNLTGSTKVVGNNCILNSHNVEFTELKVN